MDHRRLYYLSDPALYTEKELLYTEVRRREGRLLSDEAVRLLPEMPQSQPHAREWLRRRRTWHRFSGYLSSFPGPQRLLDLGCGNGWMANRLAQHPGREVWAMDLNRAELEQGARLFGRDNLRFVYGDLLSLEPRNAAPDSPSGMAFQEKFDVIVLAAAVQYFPDFEMLVATLRTLLKPGGEIHILDSPFYKNETEQAAARRRTAAYYAGLGVPQMAAYYHHHLGKSVEILGGEDLNRGAHIRFLQKIKWLPPFPWLRFKARPAQALNPGTF